MIKYILVALAMTFFGSIVDVPIVFLGVRGQISLLFIFVVGFLTDIIPDFLWYWIGSRIGKERLSKLVAFVTRKPSLYDAVGKALDRYGSEILFGSKFVYTMGLPSQIAAGSHHFPLKKFALANILGSISWFAALFVLAHFFTSTQMADYVSNAKSAFLLFALLALALHLVLGAKMKSQVESFSKKS